MNVIWIIAGTAVLLALLANGRKKPTPKEEKPTRIDHPHYIDLDDCECSVCGARFPKKDTVCPNCGTRFQATKEDDDEFIEEMVIWDDDD